MTRVIPVLHNVSSVQRVVDMARLVYSLGYDKLVVTKAYGGAAQNGIPEAMRVALKAGKNLIVLADLQDAVELLRPDKVYAVTPRDPEILLGNQPVSLEGERALIVFSGGEPDFSASELQGATRIYIEGVQAKLGPLPEAAIILYSLLREIR